VRLFEVVSNAEAPRLVTRVGACGTTVSGVRAS